jgi:hypothetical protein
MEVVCCDFELAIDLFDFGLCIADVILRMKNRREAVFRFFFYKKNFSFLILIGQK